jgi:hypothetical protein
MSFLPFTPSPDVAVILHALLDIYERRDPRRPIKRAIRVRLTEVELPGYHSQVDPAPRQTANEQLHEMAHRGLLRLSWLPGEEDHLLESVTLVPEGAPDLFPWLGREPVAAQNAALRDLLLGDRFRFAPDGWRRLAVDYTLAQLRANKSPAPFILDNAEFNRNLLDALIALDQINEETPYRVFSVRVFNDSKVFDGLKSALATLARRHGWPHLTPDEALRELGLVANPTHLFLSGPWRLVDANGQTISLANFYPAVGIPALMVARVRCANVDAARMVCVENLASFYELVRYEGEGLAALCLLGNPSPSTRHLLHCLAEASPPEVPLYVWADLDYGGLNILAQLRKLISPRFVPYRMDIETLEAHARWAKPLTPGDRRLLARLLGHASLADLHPLIAHMLERGLKLEQEAVQLMFRIGHSNGPDPECHRTQQPKYAASY